MSLVRAELRRLRKRRFAGWMLALVVALLAVVAVMMALNHQRPSPEVVAEAEARAERQVQQQQAQVEREIEECERVQESGDAAAGGWPADCEEIGLWYPSEEQLVDQHLPPAFEFRTQFPPMVTVFAGLLGMYAFLVGASFVGAEWRSGGMTNLLLWRPRRLQVLTAKLGTLLAALLGLGVLLGAAWTGGFWLIAESRGITDTMTAGAWESLGLAGARGLALVLVGGAVGFALASLGRHTATALGAAIAAVVVGLGGVAILGGMLRLPFPEAWLWSTYLRAWLVTSVEVRDWSAPCEPVGDACMAPTMEISWEVAGLGMVALVVLLVGAAMWQLRQRDVT